MRTYLLLGGILAGVLLLIVAAIASITGGRLIVRGPSGGRMCRDAVRDYLAAKGREYEVERWYPAESLKDRTYLAERGYGEYTKPRVLEDGPMISGWLLIQDSRIQTWNTSALMLTAEDRKRLQQPREKVQHARKNFSFDSTLGDAAEAYDDAVRQLVANRRQATPGWALRVEYSTDQGFGRLGHYDSVFFVSADQNVTGCVPTRRLKLIEP